MFYNLKKIQKDQIRKFGPMLRQSTLIPSLRIKSPSCGAHVQRWESLL